MQSDAAFWHNGTHRDGGIIFTPRCLDCGLEPSNGKKRCNDCWKSNVDAVALAKNQRRKTQRKLKNEDPSVSPLHRSPPLPDVSPVGGRGAPAPPPAVEMTPIAVSIHDNIQDTACERTSMSAMDAVKGMWNSIHALHEIEVLFDGKWESARVVNRGGESSCEVHIEWTGHVDPWLSRHQTIHLLSRVGHTEPPWQVRRGWPHLRVACIYSALGADAAGVALSGRCTIVYATDIDPNLHLQYGVNKTLFPVTVTEDNDLLAPDGRAKAV
jgi:hypothetical protein